MKYCQEVRTSLLLVCLISIFGSGSFETADAKNDTRISLQNGPTSDDSKEFTLKQVKDLVNDDKFDQNKNTTIFVPGYFESQWSNATDFADAYIELNEVNLLEVYYAPKVQNMDDVKQPDVEQLTPLLADWLMELSETIYWQGVNIIAYAEGVELTAHVLKSLREKSDGELIPSRVTLLDPPKRSRDLIKDNIVADFCDAIHTNAAHFGTGSSVAHLDFFLNDGYEQPACSSESDESVDICSRQYSWRYWVETVKNTKGPYFCGKKVDPFRNNEDSANEIRMGINTDFEARGNYFMDTNTSPPYAKGGDCE